MSNVVSIINGEALTTTMLIAEGVGYDHSSVIRLTRDNKEDLEEFGLLDFKSESSGGRPTEYALLNEDQATLLITYMRNNDVVRAFKKTLVKAFRDIRQNNTLSVPQSFVEALRLAADLEEEKQQALIDRDKAIATKAEIGSRREATAMATASAATRKAKTLEVALGVAENWKQTKAISWLPEIFVLSKSMYQQVGKKLTAISSKLGIAPLEIEDTQYGKVKAYHMDVIDELHQELVNDREFMGKYRIKSEEAA